jgi:diguanylate cyclase (GGDEF)-like protein
MDLFTVVILTLVINVIIGFYLSVLHHQKPKDKCFKLWAFSCASFVIGAGLGFLRQYNVSEFITFFIADSLFIAASVFILAGLIQFSHFRYTKRKRAQALTVLFFVFAALLATYQNSELISLIASLAITIAFSLCAFLLHKSTINEPIITNTLKTIFVLHSCIMLIQAALIIINWGTTEPSTLPGSSIYTFLSHIVLTTLTALLLPWLCFLKLERKLTLKSQRDGLTELSNREYFFTQVKRYWQQHSSLPTALMMIDIDLFKGINDNFGHAVGDRAIRSVANIISKQLRSHDIVGRVGGEEYAALLANIDDKIAFKTSQRLCDQIAKELRFIGEDKLELTISIGLVHLRPSDHDYEVAFKTADDALYASKNSGRNKISIGTMI